LKKALILLMLLGLVVSLVAIAGCGDKKTTIKTPEGEVTVEEGGGGEVTYETDEGDVTYNVNDEAPSEDELGAPIYPDAEYVPGSGGTSTATGPEGDFIAAGAEFTTSDSYDDVLSFYKDELGEPMIEDSAMKETSWMIEKSDGSIVTVTVTDEGGEVRIYIGRMGGSL